MLKSFFGGEKPAPNLFEISRDPDTIRGAEDKILNEKPIHRIMCYRAASGDTPVEIAQATGYSAYTVRELLAQPRSRKLIALILRENFDGDVTNILKSAAVDAVMELHRLSQEAESESVRRSSCSDILDRYENTQIKAKAASGPQGLLEEIERTKNGKE